MFSLFFCNQATCNWLTTSICLCIKKREKHKNLFLTPLFIQNPYGVRSKYRTYTNIDEGPQNVFISFALGPQSSTSGIAEIIIINSIYYYFLLFLQMIFWRLDEGTGENVGILITTSRRVTFGRGLG